MSLQLKIISDGTAHGTFVIDARTGEELVGVTRVRVSCKAGEPPVCLLSLYGIQIDMLATLPEERREDHGQTR